MKDLTDMLAQATITASQVADIDRAKLMSILEENSYAVISGLISPEDIRAAKKRIKDQFSVENDHPATGESPEDLYKNFQKFSIGSGDLREKDLAKALRTYYNPIWADDIYGMREPLRTAAQVRNLLMGADLQFAVDSIQDGFWTGARIHHYPSGGGFMQGHKEDYIPKFYEEAGLELCYYQPIILMSKRGDGEDCDYESGGGYFESRDGERCYYEGYTEMGDVVIYDTQLFHGVTEVDPRKPFRQASTEGRYIAFSTLYKDLSATSSDSKSK